MVCTWLVLLDDLGHVHAQGVGDLDCGHGGAGAALLDNGHVLTVQPGLVGQLTQTQTTTRCHDFKVFFQLHSVHFLMSTKYRFRKRIFVYSGIIARFSFNVNSLVEISFTMCYLVVKVVTKMEIYDNIDRELEKRRMSRRKLALSIGVPPSTFQSMMERKRGMTIELLKKISAALNVDFYSLADFDMASDALFEEINANRKATKEEQLLQHFRTLNDDGQTVAVDRVEELAQIPKYQRAQNAPQDAPAAPDDKEPTEK